MQEFELVNNFFSKLSKHNVSALGLNDDVFFDKTKKTVISVDTYNINTHFIDFKSPDLVIKKILRSSISDLICKGVKPNFTLFQDLVTRITFQKKIYQKFQSHLIKNKKNMIFVCVEEIQLFRIN